MIPHPPRRPTLTLADLIVLADTQARNGRRGRFTGPFIAWAEQADAVMRKQAAEIDGLRTDATRWRDYMEWVRLADECELRLEGGSLDTGRKQLAKQDGIAAVEGDLFPRTPADSREQNSNGNPPTTSTEHRAEQSSGGPERADRLRGPG